MQKRFLLLTISALCLSTACMADLDRDVSKASDYAAAYQQLKTAAEQGHPDAQFALGRMYEYGHGVPRSDVEAVRWYRRAAEKGNPEAQFNLGVMYARGLGVSARSYTDAAQWLQRSAEQGSAKAQSNLGYIYAESSWASKDSTNVSKAVRWYERAANQGDGWAQMKLGLMYAEGRGTAKNYAEAARWYQRAAEQGYAWAQVNLGRLYAVGYGTTKNYAEAARWYQRAAMQGDVLAQVELAFLYSVGRGVSKNMVRSYMWGSIAAAQEHEGARLNMNISEQQMVRDEIAVAQRLAAAFRPRPEMPRVILDEPSKKPEVDNLFSPAEMVIIGVPFRPAVGSSEIVRNVQRHLATLGYDPGAIDGRMGKVTTQAIQAYQREAGLHPDGIASPELELLLSAAVAAKQHATQPQANLASTGSGFFLNRDGHVLTNLHVVDGCKAIRVALPSGGWNAKLVAFHKGDDLAVVHSDLKPPSFAMFRGSPAALGEDVAVAGYPLHGLLSGMNLTTGTVSATSGLGGDARYVQITAPVQGGNSGGPLLDSSGAVVGVIVSKLDVAAVARATGDVAQNVNFAIKSAAVRSFLSINDIAHEAVTTDATKDRTVVAAEAQQYTVLVECWK